LRPLSKLGAPLVVAALALTACGGTTTSSTSSVKELKIGFFGALTGPDADLGKAIKNGAALAISQYNAANPKVKVTLVDFDSQGDPAVAPQLAKSAIDNKELMGLVGPAFSGESKAADPAFSEAGLVTVSPSATNPKLSTNGWKTFFRVVGNDDTQGPAAAKYIGEVLKADKVFVIDDASEYGSGLAAIVKTNLGAKAVGSDTVQKDLTDLSATVTKVRSSGANAVFYGGYYAQAGLLRKQLTEAGVTATLISSDGAKAEGFITAAGAKNAEGTIFTCPCVPTDKAAGTFAADYQKAYGKEPATYSAEGYDSAKVILDAISAGKVTRPDVLTFVKAYDKAGITKQLKFTETGEIDNVSVWAYKVVGGKIVADQEVK
jgi:branched-chain amino acid transport system substrate-binding protein